MRRFFALIGSAGMWVWRGIGNALRWKALLELLGWWGGAVGWWTTGAAAVLAALTAVGAWMDRLPFTVLFVLTLLVFFVVLGIIVFLLHVVRYTSISFQ